MVFINHLENPFMDMDMISYAVSHPTRKNVYIKVLLCPKVKILLTYPKHLISFLLYFLSS